MSAMVEAVYDPRGVLCVWEDGEPDGRLPLYGEAFRRMYGVDISDPNARMPELSENLPVVHGVRDLVTRFKVIDTKSGSAEILEVQEAAKSGSFYVRARIDADRSKLAEWASELGAEVRGD